MPAEPMDVDDEPVEGSEVNDADTVVLDEVKERICYIERAELANVPHFMARAIRGLVKMRKQLNPKLLISLMDYCLNDPSVSGLKAELLSYLNVNDTVSTPETETGSDKSSTTNKKIPSQLTRLVPEIEAFIQLLVLLYLIDSGCLNVAHQCAYSLISRCEKYNRRSLDPVLAKAYYFYTLKTSDGKDSNELIECLHEGLRKATLHHDIDCQATLVNCLLHIYISQRMFEMADSLTAKLTFPDEANSNEWARFHYYFGRVKAVELDYYKAEVNFRQALRKCSQNGALGFRRNAHKFLVTVLLLAGEIPEPHVFRQHNFSRALAPYKDLAQAVRVGSLEAFDNVLVTYKETFVQDETYTLIIRLRPNVIKTALRAIALVYSRVSFEEIKQKLHLSTVEDAEYVMAKAIAEGMIEAEIYHSEGYLQSKELLDVYGTLEPRYQFHSRAVFCFELYTQAMKAMRFPPKSYKNYETAEEKREKEQQELEFAKEMADEDDDYP